MKKKSENIEPVVNIPNSSFQSTKGRNYIGATEILTFGDGTSAWGRLVNPNNSKVCLFLDFYTLTNFSTTPYTARYFFNTIPPGAKINSPNVGNLNFGVDKLPMAKVQYNPSTVGEPKGGINILDLRIPSNETLISGQINGKVIIPPGKSILFFLISNELVEAKVVFQWTENRNIF